MLAQYWYDMRSSTSLARPLHCATVTLTLTFDPLRWKLAHQLLLNWGTFTPILVLGLHRPICWFCIQVRSTYRSLFIGGDICRGRLPAGLWVEQQKSAQNQCHRPKYVWVGLYTTHFKQTVFPVLRNCTKLLLTRWGIYELRDSPRAHPFYWHFWRLISTNFFPAKNA